MPIYIFQNPQTGETVEKFFSMNDDKVLVVNNIEYIRVFTSPNASIDTKVDPYSAKDFLKATNKKGTVGDLMNRSAELSDKRRDKEGKDPVKEKYYKDYATSRKGAQHPDKRKEQSAKRLNQLGITLE